MNRRNHKMIRAWQEAAEDLEIEIIPNYTIQINDNKEIKFDLQIKYFGSPLGTLIITLDNFERFDLPEQYGFYCSALNPHSYKTYKREHFINTLRDWQYFGPLEKRPEWYDENYFN